MSVVILSALQKASNSGELATFKAAVRAFCVAYHHQPAAICMLKDLSAQLPGREQVPI